MKAWRVSSLVIRALSKTDESETYWKCVRELQVRGTEEVLSAAAALCLRKKNAARSLGANILGQLGTPDCPYREQSLKILWPLLSLAKSPKVLNSVLVAIGHLQEKTDNRKIRAIRNFANHKNVDVRSGVVIALLERSDKPSITTLIQLSRDKEARVRDWATFGLGSLIDADTPSLRRALADRLDDPDVDTRCEALAGLARRKDTRVLEVLERELESTTPPSLVFEAAAELGDSSLLPLIKKHQNATDDNPDVGWLSEVNFAYEQLSK